jgi:hypothetical protein
LKRYRLPRLIHTSFRMTGLPRLRIPGRNSAVFEPGPAEDAELRGGLLTRQAAWQLVLALVSAAPVQIRYGLTERGRDLIVALQLLVRWGNAASR